MLSEGLGLMVAGMGMVFAFLILLVLVMVLSARIFRHFPGPVSSDGGKSSAGRPGAGRPVDRLDEVAAAIAAVKAWIAAGGRGGNGEGEGGD